MAFFEDLTKKTKDLAYVAADKAMMWPPWQRIKPRTRRS